MSCVDSEGIKRDFNEGLTIKEIAEKYIVTEDMVYDAIGKGELKRRIDATKLDQSHGKVTDGYILIPMTVYDILDEAKKECPIDKELLDNLTDGPYTLGSSKFDIAKFAVWFKKWFGKK